MELGTRPTALPALSDRKGKATNLTFVILTGRLGREEPIKLPRAPNPLLSTFAPF